MATPATNRSDRAASTSAPPGIWPMSEMKPAADRTKPMSTCVHFCVVRKTETNGPKPVCTSATKKMNQSRPRRLRADGRSGGLFLPGCRPGGGAGSSAIPSRRSRLSPKRRGGSADRIHLRHCCLFGQRFEFAERAQDDHRPAVLIFRGRLDLVASQFKGDSLVRLARLRKMQRVPVHGDLAAADAEEPSEIDNRGAHLTGAVDQDVHDPAHILVGCAEHLAAQNALDF